MRRFLLHITLSVLALLTSSLRARAQPAPFEVGAIALPELGRVKGIVFCPGRGGEEYGHKVASLGDIDGDQIDDWLVGNNRCDSLVEFPGLPEDLLLYRGVQGGLPDPYSGERIGPTEVRSFTRFLTSGDFDGDGHVDLCCRIQVAGDTSYGNTGYQIANVVVFWGNASGRYTLEDTTRLECDADMWLAAQAATTIRRGADSPAALVMGVLSGYRRNVGPVALPGMYIYTLDSGERWGRSGVGRKPVWRWWTLPSGPERVNTSLGHIDHDGDHYDDILVYGEADGNSSRGRLAILYGRSGGLPDTAEVEAVSFTSAAGHSSQVIDITGDGVAEIVLHAGAEEEVKVYIGFRGQRLAEQYGTGHDPPRPGEGWSRPWVRLPLPYKTASWPRSVDRVFNLGDADLDGVADIWVWVDGTLLCYTTGDHFNQWADAWVDFTGTGLPRSLTWSPNLDGSSISTKLIGTAGGVIYAKASRQLPKGWAQYPLPAGTGKPTTDVDVSDLSDRVIRIRPNPARGAAVVEWSGDMQCARLFNSLGQCVWERDFDTGLHLLQFSTEPFPSGLYLLRFDGVVDCRQIFLIIQ